MSRKGGRTTGCAASTSAKLVEGSVTQDCLENIQGYDDESKSLAKGRPSNMPNFGDRSSDTECDDFPNKLKLMTATDDR